VETGQGALRLARGKATGRFPSGGKRPVAGADRYPLLLELELPEEVAGLDGWLFAGGE
jgi:hypothetical protein